MHGMRHHDGDFGGLWAAGRSGRHGRGRGWGRGPGGGGGDWFRIGRMLAQGDLKLLALALIAEQPRHGYEIIKLIEEKTSGWYSPSPGVVYPTLTFLEEAGYLKDNRDIADMVLERLEGVGKKLARRRRAAERREAEEAGVPQLVAAALDNLRSAAVKRLEGDDDAGDAETRIVEILARAAQDIRNA
jgi:hypothetical protein